jgi:hypothetical protein
MIFFHVIVFCFHIFIIIIIILPLAFKKCCCTITIFVLSKLKFYVNFAQFLLFLVLWLLLNIVMMVVEEGARKGGFLASFLMQTLFF